MKQRRFAPRAQDSEGSPQTVLGIAWYRPDQWERLLAVSEDRNDLEKTHKEWVTLALRTLREFEADGIVAETVDVDVDELVAWCRARKVPVNGDSRASFTSEKLQLRYKRPAPGDAKSDLPNP